MQILAISRIRHSLIISHIAGHCAPGILGALCACLLIVPITGRSQGSSETTNCQTSKQKTSHTAGKKPTTPLSGLPEINHPVPAFTLPDTEAHTHALAELKGKPVALFFFCGCERCQRCAQTWGQLQHSGTIAPTPPSGSSPPATAGDVHSPNTVVVFMGDAESARDFAATTGLDMQQTVLLLDPHMEVTNTYHALPCPRAFALDSKQTVRYVNSHKDDDPLKAAAATLVTRTLDALTHANQAKLGQGKKENAALGVRR